MQRLYFTLLGLGLAASARTDDANWPQFRGPRGDGTTLATNLPLTWSETENVAWNTPIPGKAWASPVIWGSQVWLANATEDGTQLSVVRVDRDSGKVTVDRRLFTIEEPQFCH